ncbi:hypothetical protein CAMGR0001_0926 [Campylobacter gracilis RM3268]|uniref:Uncharacterized protein n=1 Tax=Campylobacter gracilis RM3268 TaxID=553220 RepID=C8PGD3_9BACT|nr:hypothetical protein CAMGR0001_0926 [Campylobacter gracilis RM3268]
MRVAKFIKRVAVTKLRRCSSRKTKTSRRLQKQGVAAKSALKHA